MDQVRTARSQTNISFCQQTCQQYCASSQNIFLQHQILASNTSRQLFRIRNSLLGKVKSSPLLSSIPLSELPQHFSDFFHSKVTSIRRNLDSTTVTSPSVLDQPFCGTVLGAFQSISEDEVKKILTQSTIKTCELDPLPTSFLTHCLDIFFHTSHLSSMTLCIPAFSHLLSNQLS